MPPDTLWRCTNTPPPPLSNARITLRGGVCLQTLRDVCPRLAFKSNSRLKCPSSRHFCSSAWRAAVMVTTRSILLTYEQSCSESGMPHGAKINDRCEQAHVVNRLLTFTRSFEKRRLQFPQDRASSALP